MRRITSTGGLLALGLSKPSATESGAPELSALQMLELYEREGAAIFERDLWHRFMAIENVLEEKYPSNGIERVLSDYFGDTQLSEALTEVFVTSYDIERRTPFFFRRSRARERHGWDWLMRQAARARPRPHPRSSSRRGCRPRAAARTLWPDEDDFVVVSLGTGELTRRIPYDDARGWGLAKWAQPILGVVFDGVSDDMDNATRGNIHVLRLLAEELVRSKDSELDDVCRALVG